MSCPYYYGTKKKLSKEEEKKDVNNILHMPLVLTVYCKNCRIHAAFRCYGYDNINYVGGVLRAHERFNIGILEV